jgi:chaperone required for assembly of F1-ATPase
MAANPKRFYKTVTLVARDGGFVIELDGREAKTPSRAPLKVPQARLAEAIAQEWRAQDHDIRIDTMPLTRFAYAAIDRVAPHRAGIIEQILGFGNTDLLCYRAPGPSDLVRRQSELWDPLLAWAKTRYGVSLRVGEGIGYVEQPESARQILAKLLSQRDDYRLAGLHSAVSLLGSLVLGLALEEGAIGAGDAFSAAHLDETYQAQRWGEDAEAKARSMQQRQGVEETARFLDLMRVG